MYDDAPPQEIRMSHPPRISRADATLRPVRHAARRTDRASACGRRQAGPVSLAPATSSVQC
ncbi:MAG TPA: hypothetical protein DEO57_04550 [Phycisphaerales bacterium]|nr:hypothetical protein [Phycisphaerales bacterium]